ncbi:MAG: hypothetical protein WD768_18455 [Phycisphaeraceae bacterium]
MSQRPTDPAATPLGKPRPAVFRALGKSDPPSQVEVDGDMYDLEVILKHDSWAATAIYKSTERRIVCKFNRKQWFFIIPLGWVGRWLGRREARLLTELAPIGNLPLLLGPVKIEGKVAPNAVARTFIPGHPLRWGELLDDAFLPRLKSMIEGMHARGVAYVDLHKPENIIVGDDAQPYLIDFQISYRQPRGWWWRLFRPLWFLRILQQCDRYHLQKHVIRSRPNPLPEDETELDRLRPWPIRVARFFGNRIRGCRRKLLVLLGIRRGKGLSRTESDPEDAVKRSMSHEGETQESTPAAGERH